MNRKELTPKEKMENRLRNSKNSSEDSCLSEDFHQKIQEEKKQLDEKIILAKEALPNSPEFQRLQAELIENKKTALSSKELTPKEKMENRLRYSKNSSEDSCLSEDFHQKIQEEKKQLDEKIILAKEALPNSPEFQRLQAELIENKKTALSSHERLQKKLTAHLQHKRIYLRLLNLKADIAKDFAPFVNKSNDSGNLTNPYHYRRQLMGEMLGYATLIRHIQVEINACVQLAADIFRKHSADDELKIAEVEVDAIRNLLLKKVGDGFLPPDGKWESRDSVKNFLATEDFEAIKNYLKTLKNKETIFEEFIKNIPADSEIQSISEQIKYFYMRCQDSIKLAANAYDKIPELQKNNLEIKNAQLEEKNQEARSRAARIIRDNKIVSGKITTLKLSIQNYLTFSKGVLKSDRHDEVELKVMNYDWSKNLNEWSTPYNLLSQLSRFLQEITHEKVGQINQNSGSSPPWSLIWKQLYFILKRKDRAPDEDSKVLNEFLEIEQSENTSFQELAKQKHRQPIDNQKETDDDEKSSVARERKKTETQLRVAPGSECIELIIHKLNIFYDYVKYLLEQNPVSPKPPVERYQTGIAFELKGLTDALKDSARKVEIAEKKLQELQQVAKQQHDKFFETENDEKKKSLQLQTGWTELASILSRKPAMSVTPTPKSEEKKSLSPQFPRNPCPVVLAREVEAEERMKSAIVQSRNEQIYLRLISRISAINPQEPWQKQMRNFAQAMSEFSDAKGKPQTALAISESKCILASRHDLMTQMSESMDASATDFLKPYYEEMQARYRSAGSSLYEPESLESDWQAYGKIFNLMLEKLRSAWAVHAEREDNLTEEMRATLTNKETKVASKMSAVLLKLELDAKALIEDIPGIANIGVISVYDRTIEELKDFQE